MKTPTEGGILDADKFFKDWAKDYVDALKKNPKESLVMTITIESFVLNKSEKEAVETLEGEFGVLRTLFKEIIKQVKEV